MDRKSTDDGKSVISDNESLEECSDELSSMLSSSNKSDSSESDNSEYTFSTDHDTNFHSINYGTSIQDTSLDSEAHIKNSGGELIKNKNSKLEYLDSLEKYPNSKIEEPEINDRNNHLQSNFDLNISRLTENVKGTQMPLVNTTKPHGKNNRNAGTSKSGNSTEITNRINPVFDAHQGDSAVLKEDVFSDVTEVNTTLGETAAGEVDDTASITRILREASDDSLSQSIINSDMVKTTYVDDASDYKIVISATEDFSLQNSPITSTDNSDEMATYNYLILFLVLVGYYQSMIVAGKWLNAKICFAYKMEVEMCFNV